MKVRLVRPNEPDRDERCYDVIRGAGDFSQTEFTTRHYAESGLLDEVEGLYWLDGKTAAECEEILLKALLTLQAKTSGDDWEYSCANLFMLMWGWCKAHPEGVFRVN